MFRRGKSRINKERLFRESFNEEGKVSKFESQRSKIVDRAFMMEAEWNNEIEEHWNEK